MIANWGDHRPLRLMFQNKARFSHITDKCYCWCRRPDCSLVSTMVTQQYTYAYGAASLLLEALDSPGPHVNGDCMQIFINEMASHYSYQLLL